MASPIRSILPWAVGSVVLVAAGGAAWGGSSESVPIVAGSAAAGATCAVSLQFLAARAYGRALSGSGAPDARNERSVLETNERALRALGAAAAIRLFGGVLVIVAATQVDVVALWPFVAGFAVGYAVLEFAVGRWLIAQERRG